ncbi:MAG: serine/threonine protein kinase [Deltaproteobacteria bacterium]|nr:serine/threonine protein kinase [Deltaproteobacteria bacterium]
MVSLEPSLPKPFGKYTLLRSLGYGGTAEIFLARGPQQTEPLVIKRLLPELSEEPQFLAMLVSEAKVAALLDHPALVRIHELGKEDGQVYMAMEYVPGWDLRALAKVVRGRVPFGVAARIGLALAEALHHAHRRTDLEGRPLHLVHRDVTPSNVMVTAGGEVKLIDFGVAKASTQITFTQPGFVKGKYRFLSPEQIEQKRLDGRSDLFSLGVTLYEVTTGVEPFDREQIVDILKAILRFDPEPPSTLVAGFPPALEAVLMHSLTKDRDQRYPDAQAMANALRQALPHIGGPGDVGAWVRQLAAAHPDRLPPCEEEELGTEMVDFPEGEDPSSQERCAELMIVNLPDAVEREPDHVEPWADWLAEPLSLRVAEPLPEPPAPLRRPSAMGRNTPAAMAMPPSLGASRAPAWTHAAPSLVAVETASSRRPRRRVASWQVAVGLTLLAGAVAAGTVLVLQYLLAAAGR